MKCLFSEVLDTLYFINFGPSSIPGQFVCDLRWRKRLCDRMFPKYFCFACQDHSIPAAYSIFIHQPLTIHVQS
jgi:hypothetical protein